MEKIFQKIKELERIIKNKKKNTFEEHCIRGLIWELKQINNIKEFQEKIKELSECLESVDKDKDIFRYSCIDWQLKEIKKLNNLKSYK